MGIIPGLGECDAAVAHSWAYELGNATPVAVAARGASAAHAPLLCAGSPFTPIEEQSAATALALRTQATLGGVDR